MTIRSSDGVDVALHDLGGHGPELLVAHANGLHGRCYQPLADALADAAHVCAPDLRGHGDTPAPAGWAVDWRRISDDVEAVAVDRAADGSAGGPIVGFGHSLGGAALLMAALRRPGLFRALVLFEPIVLPPGTPRGSVGGDLAARARRRRSTFASFDEAYAHFSAKPPLNAFTPAALRAYVDHGFHVGRDGNVHLACTPELEAEIFETGSDHDTWSRLHEVAPPVWVIGGQVTEGHPSSLVAGIADRIPRGTLVEMDDVRHFGPLTDPERVAAVVRDAMARAVHTDGDR